MIKSTIELGLLWPLVIFSRIIQMGLQIGRYIIHLGFLREITVRGIGAGVTMIVPLLSLDMNVLLPIQGLSSQVCSGGSASGS